MSELRELLERFANGKSMDKIFDATDALIDDARRDEEFQDWVKRFYAYIRKVSSFLSFARYSQPHNHTRLYWKLATFLKRSATMRAMRCASRDANSGTKSIVAISTTYSMRLEIGSLLWERTR